MQDNTPSVGFDAGGPAKTPYIKIALFAIFGVVATVILMSMLVKPKFYASLMGAEVNDYVASSDNLTRVAANAPLSVTPTPAISLSPYPTISGFVSPTVTPVRISITPAPSRPPVPVILKFSRVLYKDGIGQSTGPSPEVVSYECGDMEGRTKTGRISLNIQTTNISVTLNNNFYIFDCNFEVSPPQPLVGYVWLEPYISVYDQFTQPSTVYPYGLIEKLVVVSDRLIRIGQSVVTITPTSTPIRTPTPWQPTITPTRSPTPSFGISRTPTPWQLTATPTRTLTPVANLTPNPVLSDSYSGTAGCLSCTSKAQVYTGGSGLLSGSLSGATMQRVLYARNVQGQVVKLASAIDGGGTSNFELLTNTNASTMMFDANKFPVTFNLGTGTSVQLNIYLAIEYSYNGGPYNTLIKSNEVTVWLNK